MATLQDLRDFIDIAARNRKYPESTAQGLKVALKLFDEVLNDEERQSLEIFKRNLPQIFQSLSVKNAKNFTASSLAAYKSRVLKVIDNYEKYGIDPTKLGSWSPKPITRKPRKQPEVKLDEEIPEQGSSPTSTTGMHNLMLELRPNTKFLITVPRDMNSAECATLKAVLETLIHKPQSEA